MNHPDRINTTRLPGRKVAPAGWITIYTLAALMFGALAYFAGK